MLPLRLSEILSSDGQRLPLWQLETRLRAADPNLNDSLARAAQVGAQQAEAALEEVDPAVLLNHKLLSRAVEGDWGSAIRLAGSNRFNWVLGVAATGHNRSKRPLRDFFQGSAVWFGCTIFASFFHSEESDLPIPIKLAGDFERARRLMSTDIRFTWVSRLLAECVAAEAAEHRDRYQAMAFLTSASIEAYYRFVLSDQPWPTYAAQKPPALESARLLLQQISLPAGHLANRSFPELVLSTHIERYPVVLIGENYAATGTRECTVHLEQAIFEAARRLLPVEKDRSDLYEGAISRMLTRTLPGDFEHLVPPITAPVPSDRDPRETDFACVSPSLALLGEAKAYFITERDDSVINAFGNQVPKAVNQLSTRIEACTSRRSLMTGSGDVSIANTAAVRGVAVPLHSYGSAVWAGEALRAVDALRDNVAVIPLHQLVYVARAMSNAEELRGYLGFRSRLLEQAVQIQDEGDLLRAFLVVPKTLRLQLERMEEWHGAGVMVVHNVSVLDALLTPEPPDADTWRRQFTNIARRDEDLIAHTT